MEGQKKRITNTLVVIICLVLCLGSAISTRLIATSGGQVIKNSIEVISDSGYTLAMDVYKPKEASVENKLPAIVVMHGGNNAKEQVNHLVIELARRGYVVVNADMYGHGESEKLPNETWLSAGRGFYDAIKYAAKLPYVDTANIGVLGYSRGGRASGECMVLDNAAEPKLIKNMYIIHSDPVYKLDDAFADVYGSRNVAVLADKYDEFFFSEKAEVSGATYNAEANRYATSSTTPVDYIINPSAQSFLYFGQDPATTSELRTAETVYEKTFDNGIGTRQINVTNETHMQPWFSSTVMTNTLAFFNRTMPTATSLTPTNHIYTLYFFSSLVGLASLLVLLVTLAYLLIARTKVFAAVQMEHPTMLVGVDSTGKLFFWVIQMVVISICVIILWMMNKLKLSTFWDTIFRSSIPAFHAIFVLLCAAVVILALVAWYLLYGKKKGFDFKRTGFTASWSVIWKSFAVALLAVVGIMVVVFAADYFLNTNYMFIYWGFMAFDAERILHMVLALPFFVTYYTIMSFSINCFNYNDSVGKRSWVNTALVAFLAAVPTLFVILYVYIIYKATNWNPLFGGMASAPTWIIALPGIVLVFITMSRIVYKRTGNPYLAGFLPGILATVAAWTVAEIRVPTVGAAFKLNWQVYLLILVGFGISIASYIFLRKESKEGK